MRTIKFRAWDGKMMHDARNGSNFYIELTAQGLLLALDHHNHGKTVELMQFTGLLDKNGKEIYEGYVVKVAENQQYEIVWLEELEYEEKCAGWGLKQIKGVIPPYLIDTYAIKHSEIIGNIYENPELLTP